MMERKTLASTGRRVRSPYLKVPKVEASRTIKRLKRERKLNSELEIIQRAKFILVPLLDDRIPFSGYGNFHYRKNKIISKYISFKAFNETFISPKKFRWVRIGRSLIIKNSYLRSRRKRNLSLIARVLNVDTIYVDHGISDDLMRIPKLSLIFGKGGITSHKENGVIFTLDPGKTMFSPGNVNIRGTPFPKDLVHGIALDMFAGIGYFSLPLARKNPDLKVYVAEINPVSFTYLERNVSANGLSHSVIPFNGDCRLAFPDVIADIIIMGHFESIYYLSAALLHSHPGTVLNMHIVADSRKPQSAFHEVNERAKALGAILDLISTVRVKSYGPGMDHLSTLWRVSRFV